MGEKLTHVQCISQLKTNIERMMERGILKDEEGFRVKDYLAEEGDEEIWGFIRNTTQKFILSERTEKLLQLTKEKIEEQKKSPRKFGLPPIVVTDREMGDHTEEDKFIKAEKLANKSKKKRKASVVSRADRIHWKQ